MLWTFVHDSAGPRLRTADLLDSTSLRLSFSQPLDPATPLDSARVRVFALPDSTPVAVTAVLTPAAYDSLTARESARADSLRRAADTTAKRDTTAQARAPNLAQAVAAGHAAAAAAPTTRPARPAAAPRRARRGGASRAAAPPRTVGGGGVGGAGGAPRARGGAPPAEGWGPAVRACLERLAAPSFVPVINATGVVLHTNLGRAPLAATALAAMHRIGAGYASLEYDVGRGSRGSRQRHCRDLLVELTGAEDALVVNNAAGALLGALSALGRGGGAGGAPGGLGEGGGGGRGPGSFGAGGAPRGGGGGGRG